MYRYSLFIFRIYFRKLTWPCETQYHSLCQVNNNERGKCIIIQILWSATFQWIVIVTLEKVLSWSRREFKKTYMKSKLSFQKWVSYKLMLAWIAGIFLKCENKMVISQDIYNCKILNNYIFSHLSMCANISTDKFTEKREIYSFTRHLPKDKLHQRSWIFYHFDGLYLEKKQSYVLYLNDTLYRQITSQYLEILTVFANYSETTRFHFHIIVIWSTPARENEMATTLTNGKFRTEKRAPEGGWGYFVGIGMALPFVSTNIQFFPIKYEWILIFIE